MFKCLPFFRFSIRTFFTNYSPDVFALLIFFFSISLSLPFFLHRFFWCSIFPHHTFHHALRSQLSSLNHTSISHIFFILYKTVYAFFLCIGSNEREFFFDEESKEYFFDRCPQTFPYILNYYRTGKLHFPKSNCLSSYEEELTFFRITPDAIGK